MTLLIIGAVLVFGASLLAKIIKWVSLLTFKIIGMLVVIAGVLYVFDII